MELLFVIIELAINLFHLFASNGEQTQFVDKEPGGWGTILLRGSVNEWPSQPEKGDKFLFLLFLAFPLSFYLVGILAYELFGVCQLFGC